METDDDRYARKKIKMKARKKRKKRTSYDRFFSFSLRSVQLKEKKMAD
jgi:hypothetical protein